MKHKRIVLAKGTDAPVARGADSATMLRKRVLADGYAIVPSFGREAAEPWTFVQELLGVWPEMVERQPIRPRDDGRSFASTTVFTPFHTDSQDFRGAPPGLQIMVCRRSASDGGATRLLDTRRLLARLESEAPELVRELRGVSRCHRFYFGDVTSPTVADKRGHTVFTHSPIAPTDSIGAQLAAELDKEPVITLRVCDDEILVVDNHRMLHGREAFTDRARDFTRVLAWLPRPLAHVEIDHDGARPATRTRISVVLELLAGVPPARLAAREGVSEAELYAWRSQALAAARDALDG
jgi:gamma-butyrobetaine dioxygenase